MKLANEIWKLLRDIALVGTGCVGLLVVVPSVQPTVALELIPACGALFVLPWYLRRDEREG